MTQYAVPEIQGDVEARRSGTAFAPPGAGGDLERFLLVSVFVQGVMDVPIARTGFPITPSDSVDLPGATTGGIYVGTGGTLVVTFISGATAQLTVPAGLAPICVTRVWNTGTSASDLSGLIGN